MTREQSELLENLKGYTITVDADGATITPELPDHIVDTARKNRRLIIWAALREEYRESVNATREIMRRLDDGTASVAEFNTAYDRTAELERLARHHGVEDLIPEVLHG